MAPRPRNPDHPYTFTPGMKGSKKQKKAPLNDIYTIRIVVIV
jgi:hypothetical protein